MKEPIKYKRKNDIPWQVLEGSAILLTPAESSVHELNFTATWIWQKLESDKTFPELHEELCDEFEVESKRAELELEAIIQEMLTKKMIEPCRPQA